METQSPSLLGSGIKEVIKSITVLDMLNTHLFSQDLLKTKGLVKGYLLSPIK